MTHQHANYKEIRSLYRITPVRMPFSLTMMAILALLLVLASCTLCHASNDVDIAIISQIESSNNPNAYNKHSHARGLCQITPIVLKEFNKINHKHYSLDDLFIDQINLLIADWYINHRIPKLLSFYGLADNIRNRLIAYNFGIGNMRKSWFLPRETREYLIKYERGI